MKKIWPHKLLADAAIHSSLANMRAKEFIQETTKPIRKSVKGALPSGRIHYTLDNSNPYHSYRYGIALASSPDDDMFTDGPYGSKLLTVGYTEADREIIEKADKILGVKSTPISADNSIEVDTTNTVSPVAKPKKNKYGV